jgi:hypothetical protein
MDFCIENTVANGNMEFDVLTKISNSKKNVPKKMQHYNKNGDELSGTFLQ